MSISRRNFLAGAIALALAPVMPTPPVSLGIIDTVHRPVPGGGIPGVYGWGGHYGTPQFFRHRGDGHHISVLDNFHVKEA